MGGKSKPAGQLSESWRLTRILLRPQNRGIVLAASVFVLAILGLVMAWQRWGRAALDSPEYRVTPEKINITPQPEWIHVDVKAEVVQNAGLNERPLTDPRLVEEVAAAFALHPWVARVIRVEKRFPAAVDVALAYRKPVAAVEVASREETGLLFVDAEGVLLPSSDFAQNQARNFLRIAAGQETPAGGYGAPWGSNRVAGAARIAAAWQDRWQALGLYRIAVVEASAGRYTYELRTKKDTRVIWGAAPGDEDPGEAAVEQKIAALEHQVAEQGPLDREGAPGIIDLRRLAQPARSP